MLSEGDETGVAVRGTQEMSVMFGIACVCRGVPVSVDSELSEKAVEMFPTSAERAMEGVSSVEFDPAVCTFRIVKYAV